MNVILLAAAREDLTEIWTFGAIEWSMSRADAYFGMLMAAIGRLGDHPLMAPPAAGLGPGYRRLVVRAHVVFYRVEGDVVEVVRVLHQSRDAGRWVKDVSSTD